MKKNVILFVGIMSLLLTVTACGGKEQKDASKETKQSIAIVVDQEMSGLDSVLTTDTYSFTALNNVMEGLYRLSETNELTPAGAAALPEISEDKLTYHIKLNQKAKWSNDEPVTANDYVFAWRRAVAPETAAEYASLFGAIENATEITAGKAESSSLGIKALNDYELEIKLNKALPYFESLLAMPTFFPQNEKFVTQEGSNYAKTSDNLIYNGPFILDSFEGVGTDTEWNYLKNDNYWDHKTVKLETIKNQVVKESATRVNLFEAGEVDDIVLTGELAKQYQADDAFVSIKKAGTTYLSYNQTKKEYQSKNIRKAISLILDRNAIVDQILGDGSIASTGLVPSDMSFSPNDAVDFAKESGDLLKLDLEAGKKLWKEELQKLGLTKVKIDLLAYDTDSIKKVAEYIQSEIETNLEGADVDVSIVPVSVAIEKGKNTDFDLFLFGWGADYPDPSSFLDLLLSDSPYNYGKYQNKAYDELVTQAATVNLVNPEKRWDDMINAEKLLMEDSGVAPLFQKGEARLRNPNLKNVISYSTGAQFSYKYAYLTTN